MKIIVSQFIQAAHQLPDSESLVTKECRRLHGHTYFIKTIIENEHLVDGMVVDFGRVKEIVNELDHRFINEIFQENDFNHPTTAENIGIYLIKRISTKLNFPRSAIFIEICEGYKGEELSNWIIVNGYDNNEQPPRPVRTMADNRIPLSEGIRAIPSLDTDFQPGTVVHTTNDSESLSFTAHYTQGTS